MNDKKVAATVILHLNDGSKKFLTKTMTDHDAFAYTEFSNQKTALANILQLLKKEAELDIENIHLVELTNGQLKDHSIPFFVFETLENQQKTDLPEQYHWVSAPIFREILQRMEIEGVPFF